MRDSFFEFLLQHHKDGIGFYASQATINNIEMNRGSVGVNVDGDSSFGPSGSTATVINSRFVGAFVAGVLVQWTKNSRIADNEFINCETGVSVDTKAPGDTTGLIVEGNLMEGGFRGVHFWGTSDCEILKNVIREVSFGIFLDANMACPDERTPECFYATRNVISGNELTDNYMDLFHDENAVGNTWENNTCHRKRGAEIPACTAR